MSADDFVRCVLDTYRSIPDTPRCARPADRRLAVRLHDRGVKLEIIVAAFVLATARRHDRGPDADPLLPVRSLAYYLPVVEELLAHPPPPGYCEHLRRRLTPSAPALIATINHHLP